MTKNRNSAGSQLVAEDRQPGHTLGPFLTCTGTMSHYEPMFDAWSEFKM